MRRQKHDWLNNILRCILALFVALAPASAQADAKDDVAKLLITGSNDVVAQLTELKQGGGLSSASALAVIQKTMSPLLDFERLTQRAMAKHWRRASAQEKQDIVTAFRALLENTYAKVLSRYSGQQVQLVEAKDLANDKISVVMKVSGENKSAEIDYIMEAGAGGDYKATDIKIEGISLVANYRRQFKSVIAKAGGVPGLVTKLQQMAAAKIQ